MDTPSRTRPGTRQQHGQAGSRRRLWRDLLVVGYSHAGQHAYVAGVGVTIPFVVAAFHVSYALVGLLLAVVGAVGSLFQLLAGVVRRSTRLLLVGQNLGSAVGAALGAVAPGIGVFFVGRCVQAVSTWPQHPVGSAYLSDRYPARRGTILSWHVTAGNAGTLLAPLAVSAVIAAHGWRWGYVLLAAMLVSTLAVVGLGLDAPWTRPTVAARSRWSARDAGKQLVALCRQRPVAALLLAGVVAAGGQGIGILSVYVPGYLKTGLGYRPLTLGTVLTVMYVGAVAGPLLMGYLADRWSHRWVLVANYVCGAAALAGFAFGGRSPLLLAPVAVAVGVFSYSELSLRQTAFSDYLSSEAARAGFGLFFAISQAIGAVWVAIIGLIVTDTGFHAAFTAMLLTFLAAALLVVAGTARGPSVRRVVDRSGNASG